jgi:MATE family multidrug resistance protein
VLIGQLSVVAFATVDTMLVARHSPLDLAALAVGASAYVTVFIGLMGVVLAVGPIVGQLFGAGHLAQAGRQLHQAVWLALGLSLLGSTLLLFRLLSWRWRAWSPRSRPRCATTCRRWPSGLPASLLFAAYRGFNTAVSRPKAVMVLQLGGLASQGAVCRPC